MNIGIIQQKAEEMRILNLAVMKDGELLLKKDWDEEIRRNQYSASKSFTGIAVGIAQKEGLLELNEKLCDIFHERDGLGTLYAVPSFHTEARNQFFI